MKRFLLLPLGRFLAKRPALVLVLLALYLLSPFDILPEAFTGFVGYLDDVLLVALGLIFLRRRGKSPDPVDSAKKAGKVIETSAEIKREKQ